MAKIERFDKDVAELYIFHLNMIGILSYSFVSSNLPLIDSIYFGNNTKDPLKNLKLKISFSMDFVEPYEQDIPEIAPGKMLAHTPVFRMHIKELIDLTETFQDKMRIQIQAADDIVLIDEVIDLPVFPMNAWPGITLFPESIASFVMPNIPQIAALQTRAAQILKDICGSSAFSGYQGEDKNHVRQQMAAIYATIFEQNINYLSAAFFEDIGQRVRLPHEVLKVKQGNCIEMAVLFCSLAESCGLHPFIVVVEGHAFAGAWLSDSVFDNNVVTDIAEISKRLAHGINDIEVFECTTMNQGNTKTFEQSVKIARDKLLDEECFIAVIDVYRSHFSGVRPMPLKVVEEGEVKIIDYGLAEDAESKAVTAQTIEEYFLDTSQKAEMNKCNIWMRNLLDLSKRNSLISFRKGPRSLQLFNADLPALEDALSKGEAFEIREVVNDWQAAAKNIDFVDVETSSDVVSKISNAEFKSRRLRTFVSRTELDKTLKQLYREAKKSLEENGSNTLYLATGFLRYIDETSPKDADGNRPARLAPLVLLPIDLQRKSNGLYALSLRDEDAQMNITLLEFLRQNYGLEINGLNPLPIDEYGVDMKLVFGSIRKAIMSQPGWDVVEIACLGLFSFSQFVMWNDLRTRFDQLTENKTVKALVKGFYEDYPEKELKAQDLDTLLKVGDIAIASSVDSSQLLSIVEAANGTSFVLHGPPGTGKSQTITNMIANALYQGKSILFVAEKMAALSVVEQRLQSIGLAEFCLELYSNKTQKKVLLDKLQQNMNMAEEADLKAFKRQAERLELLKTSLNEQVYELHRERPQGHSLYQLISMLINQGQGSRSFQFPQERLQVMSIRDWESWKASMQRLITAAAHLAYPIPQHPLKAFKKSSYALRAKAEWDKLRERLDSSLNELIQIMSRDEIVSCLNGGELSGQDLRLLTDLEIIRHQRNLKTKLNNDAFTLLFDEDINLEIKNLLEQAKVYNQSKIEIEQNFNPDIINFNWIQCKNDFLDASRALFITRSGKQKQALQALNVLAHAGHRIDAENADHELARIAQYQDRFKNLSESMQTCLQKLSLNLPITVTDMDALEDLYVLSDNLRKERFQKGTSSRALWSAYKLMIALNDLGENGAGRFIARYEGLMTSLRELSELTGISVDDVIKQSTWMRRLQLDMSKWDKNIDEWKSWSYFYAMIEQLNQLGLNSLTSTILNPAEHDEAESVASYCVSLMPAYISSLCQDLIELHLQDSPSLERFSGKQFESQIQEYNQLLDEYETLCQNQIRARLSQQVPRQNNVRGKEAEQLAFLSRAVRSKGRGLSIRNIFQSSGEIIKKVTPCLLMSPLSVAQYIDPDFPQFDLVIFDEASQIRTSVAVGALSRAKDCVIVGDPNQMPPTSFFTTQNQDDENIQLEDLESLLDDALAINMPQRYLEWHYRSQSESLIAFSNSMYYESRMKTFPSPFERISKVKLVNVGGTYDRGVSRTNRAEAIAIVDEMVRRLKDEQLRQQSMGVVTFNIAQQNLIDDLLLDRLQKDSALDRIARSLKEEYFIKNLENVQGDERDVIFFSICYGPDDQGKMTQNFGPINRKGGWRRLNVAATRARQEMYIYCSMEPEAIEIRPTSSEGLLGIRGFLDFAKRGRVEQKLAHKRSKKDEELIQQLANFLRSEGFSVDTQVGSSQMTLDLAVRDPIKLGHYLCTILLDGDQYANAVSTRDRLRLTPSVLERMGWRVYRIWTLDWYDHREKEEQRLIRYIRSLLPEGFDALTHEDPVDVFEPIQTDTPDHLETTVAVESLVKSDPDVNEDKSQAPDAVLNEPSINVIEDKKTEPLLKPFVETIKPDTAGIPTPNSETLPMSEEAPTPNALLRFTQYQYFDAHEKHEYSVTQEKPAELTRLMQAIVAIEAPIAEELLIRRCFDFYNDGRMSKNIFTLLQSCAKKGRFKSSKQAGQIFYWNKDSVPNDYDMFRLPAEGDKRELESLSDYELANGLALIAQEYVLKDGLHISLSEESLMRELNKRLGQGRYTEKSSALIKTAVSNAIYRGFLQRERKNLVLGPTIANRSDL